MRGLVQEVLSLVSWVVALFALHHLHRPMTEFLMTYIYSPNVAAVIAFVLLLLIPYGAMKLIVVAAAHSAGTSAQGPVDRVLGLGFGIIKGVIMAVLAFAVLALGYDAAWGVAGRPAWITTARSYPFINAASDQLLVLLDERRRRLSQSDDAADSGSR